MSSIWGKGSLALGAFAMILVAAVTPFSGVPDVAHEAVRLHLTFFGSSIYEYHAIAGNWPTQLDDFAKTSLPAQSPYWRSWFDNDAMVIIWHKTLKPDPKDNARDILVYHNKGLIAKLGQSWVCWGDLRTEYIKTEELQAYLKNLKD